MKELSADHNKNRQLYLKYFIEKSPIRETPNLSTDADSITDIFVSGGVEKGADSIFLF